MSDTPPPGGPNRTVFRPSPLSGLAQGQGAAPQGASPPPGASPLAAAAAAVLAAPAAAQPLLPASRDTVRDASRFSFEARGPYRAAVPRPEALLGFRLGDRNAQYAEQERVLLAIAQAALGNPPGAAAIETTIGGVALRCVEGAVTVASVGGGFHTLLDGAAVGAWAVFPVREGSLVVVCWTAGSRR